MPFKINISTKDGKTWKLESESESIVGKALGEKIQGSDISADLAGYEFHIAGASDIAGFPHKETEEGPQLRGVLLTKGWGMHKRPRKEGKKPVGTPKGFRKRKTCRGKVISEKTVQINLILEKSGSKTLAEIFPEQNKAKEPEKKEEALAETPTEAPKEKPEPTPEPTQEAPKEKSPEPEPAPKPTPEPEPSPEKPEPEPNPEPVKEEKKE